MKKNQDYKNEALAALKGNWAQAVVATVIFLLLCVAFAAPSWVANMVLMGQLPLNLTSQTMNILSWVGSPFMLLIFYPLSVGYMQAYDLHLTQGDNAFTVNTFRLAFSKWLRNVWAVLLVAIFTFLWTLLLVIPGIVKGLAYSMTFFIIRDYPELSVNQAINLSDKMMKGRKFDFFYLNLSFIGWMLLSVLTCGIGLVWLCPYMYASYASFYQDVKNDFIRNNN